MTNLRGLFGRARTALLGHGSHHSMESLREEERDRLADERLAKRLRDRMLVA